MLRMNKVILLLISIATSTVSAEDIGLDFDMDMSEPSKAFIPKAVDRDYIRGWIDYRTSSRYNDHPDNSNQVLNELRAQIETVNYFSGFETHLRVDGLIDYALDEETLSTREAYIKMAPAKWLDVSVGRQIMLWSTADLIFVNDLFPKDYLSFYAGRDAEQEYLMLPMDAINFSIYVLGGEIDFVYQPHFTPYDTPTGERMSFYNPLTGSVAGENNIFTAQDNNNEVFYLRYLTQISSVEFGVYAYDGYWYSPFGFDMSTNEAYYPELESLGVSARASVAGGIMTGEVAYYNSPEDSDGSNPLVVNDSVRAYVGYEHELVKDLTMNVQFYTEAIKQFDNYVASGGTDKETYNLWTLRLTQNLLKQTLVLSAFIYYSPTDEDHNTRLNVYYAPSDKWMLHAGVNDFSGSSNTTRLGQLEQNSNVYASVKRKF